jgi:hypothetical protein
MQSDTISYNGTIDDIEVGNIILAHVSEIYPVDTIIIDKTRVITDNSINISDGSTIGQLESEGSDTGKIVFKNRNSIPIETEISTLLAGDFALETFESNGGINFCPRFACTVEPARFLQIYTERTQVTAGETITLKVRGFDYRGEETDCGSVCWESSNPSVGTINSVGVFTARLAGSTVISATAKNLHDSICINVAEKPSSSGRKHSSGNDDASDGGGGGGSGNTGEDFYNIEIKEVKSIYVLKGVNMFYRFGKEENNIEYVSFTAKKTAGQIDVLIEILIIPPYL